ncbi:acyl-CoA dehydrogenase [Thermoplasma volcanium GSS1]|uniref:Acyl-CoA dehydrogenase n=1 Tax=Thermoplasma volcanium (strain ATCC 51530 / DSM 4299 / JCM 9571 / NBRC 15438 / GSS1) TaxID=273116 RepID=Q978T7_THEVO|nr:acyl-CoA dehydrogenase family protein [Thermoplasma volcanium]BAB60470.1 acyl-CoA dehydrogenase [Thermoplasma volcanium GSS1]
MNFELDENLLNFRKKIEEFAKREFTEDLASKYDEQEHYPEDVFTKMMSEGIFDYTNPWNILMATEALCKYDAGMGISMLVPFFGNEVIALFGNDEQKKKYLSRVFAGKAKMGLAVTEPGGGSDVANIKTTAVKEGDHYVLNGSKMFITNGDIADFFVLLARTSQEKKKHHGMSVFIVERDFEGFRSNKIKGKLGVRATDTAELTLENVKVPEENLVGEPGRGFYYIMTFFDISRAYVAAQALGIAEGILERTLSILQKDGPLTSQPERVQFTIADMATRIEATKLLTYEAASYIFNFNPNPAVTSMAKAYAAETAVYVSRKAMEVTGIDGLTSSIERSFRDAKIMEIWEGTSEIEKLVIARMLKTGDVQ